ncbi:FecR domain-containing protein [Pseudomonas sp. PDM14]|uniref:FecR family protein n=1 Tax=Pseudomonas sp. PDM14 TaxID=2769288 RepID=UPI0017845108|nr:FecR domain-containing protein [Pseudomonas sp. PDM14]MBD9484733.1 FecR domain-containing protein [Pseudomonas sp. PDM14]
MFALKRIGFYLFASLLMSPALSAAEQKPIIGYVMKVQGEAFVQENGQLQPAVVGTPLHLGSLLKTGPTGSMGVTLEDSTVMSVGPQSELSIDAYAFEPSQDSLQLSARITRGTLNYISGIIAKLKPEAVQINTPTGTIGVRGTHFLVKVS